MIVSRGTPWIRRKRLKRKLLFHVEHSQGIWKTQKVEPLPFPILFSLTLAAYPLLHWVPKPLKPISPG